MIKYIVKTFKESVMDYIIAVSSASDPPRRYPEAHYIPFIPCGCAAGDPMRLMADADPSRP